VEEAVTSTIDSFHPDIVAASVKTPVYPVTLEIFKTIKTNFPSITTIVGGVHITACPEEAAQESCFDILAVGEGDTVLPEILSGKPLEEIAGLVFRDKLTGQITTTPKRPMLPDLNELPFPAWQLFDLPRYKNSRLSSRQNPVGHIETSRGCSYSCNFCSKLTFGTFYRVKRPQRVVDEMEYMLKCGFKEIHIADDSFTQDIARAKEVCEEIIRRGLKFPWSLINGVRVNLVDEEFFRLAKRAGLWQVGFGIETGDETVLERINKRADLDQVRQAVTAAEKAGVDSFGFFILGLAGETEQSMEKTIQLAKSLPLSTAKFDLCIPYPGTRYFEELAAENRIRSRNWADFVVHQVDKPLFDHPNLTWSAINKYYHRAFREFYLRPSYILHRLWRDIRNGDLLYDVAYFLKSKW